MTMRPWPTGESTPPSMASERAPSVPVPKVLDDVKAITRRKMNNIATTPWHDLGSLHAE